jgi:predicted MFS family arabinose efflux permease
MDYSATSPALPLRPARSWLSLAVLFLVVTSSYFDYYVLSVVLEPIKREFQVSDTSLGLLGGLSFALLYSVTALPIARWSDRGNRRTVITFALIAWSVMTLASGWARTFWQLALARVGVGMVEPGAVPPSQSLVTEYFPPERRGTATSLLNSGSAAGYLVGIGIGGWVASAYGWRAAFIAAGGPGLILAVIVRFFLVEPRCERGFPAGQAAAESWTSSLRVLSRKRSFLFVLLGASVYTVFTFGTGIFLPSFLIRDLHASTAQISGEWAPCVAVASLAGCMIGGRIADALSRWDIRWYAWLPGAACVLGAPFYWAALATSSVASFIVFNSTAEFVLGLGIAVSFAPVHAVCGSLRRTQAIAIMQLSFILIGAGLGPVIAGGLSDFLNTAHGSDSLRAALLSMILFLFPAAAAFFWAGRSLPRELEE